MQGATIKGIFCLCVENVMHVLDPFFFTSSHGVGKLFTYKVLVVISGPLNPGNLSYNRFANRNFGHIWTFIMLYWEIPNCDNTFQLQRLEKNIAKTKEKFLIIWKYLHEWNERILWVQKSSDNTTWNWPVVAPCFPNIRYGFVRGFGRSRMQRTAFSPLSSGLVIVTQSCKSDRVRSKVCQNISGLHTKLFYNIQSNNFFRDVGLYLFCSRW